jgi:hypothetical protein
MSEHVRWISADAGLGVSDDMIDYVVRVGGWLGARHVVGLDQVIAAGGIAHDDFDGQRLVECAR